MRRRLAAGVCLTILAATFVLLAGCFDGGAGGSCAHQHEAQVSQCDDANVAAAILYGGFIVAAVILEVCCRCCGR